MSSLSRELVFLILQFLDEEKFKETVHKLEQESGFFFNMKHFEDQVQAGEWDEVERHDRAKAVEILVKDLKVFASFNEELFKEITQLLTLDNFRQNEQLSKYGDTKSARNIMLMELKKLIEANPLFRDKLTFPPFKTSRLRTLINQSLNWQHQLCKNPRPNPDIKTLFTDHTCSPNNGARPPPTNNPLVGPIPKAGTFPPIGAHSVSFSGATHPANIYSQDDLPKTVVRTLNQGTNVMSMDFHPQQQTILLVGTNVGDIAIWEVGSRERLVHKTFKVWEISSCSMTFQIDAHNGGVNDIAFAHPNKQLCIITCGDDKTIKVVWDAVIGRRQYIFEGHEAPVYSVCPHYKEAIQFVFSTAIDGKIKAWLYDCLGSRVDYDAPGRWCTTMAYSADGTRLFSCGTSKEGDSHLVEWNESEGAIKREYSGFRKHSLGVVQFDTTRNRFLAAGDEFQIKFWDMDNTNILTTTDADGGLPASPRLRFNKEGSLLALTTSDNGIKILANVDGQRLIKMLENRAYEGPRGPSEPINMKPQIANALAAAATVSAPLSSSLERSDRIPPVSMGSLVNMDANRDVKPRISDDVDKIKSWKLADMVDSTQLKALRLPDHLSAGKIVRLIYTNSGLALLALASNAVHKLWKWQRTDRNPSGKSTASFAPQFWQPPSGTPMANDTSETNPAEDSAACIALSKNDSYVMSASGGKVMTTFMPPPPAATFLAFHPQDNNIIAIGMDDSTIQIYNVRIDEVKIKLKGHQKRITGLAFSQALNVLVSSGADAHLCVWSIDGWEKKKSRFIQAPPGRPGSLVGETKVQFHNDQLHILVVHESQIAIYDSKLECLRLVQPLVWF
ncbi:Protein TOPLESS-RELATED PROTEIN 2 [Asimina triloba]